MKHLLLFFSHSQPVRPGGFSISELVFCWSNTCENKWMTFATKYVSLYTEISNEKIKNLLFLLPKNGGKNPCKKQGYTSDLCMHFFSVFNADIQCLTTVKAIALSPSVSILKTSVVLFSWRSSHPLNALSKFSFYEQTYEHFYRLRSLIEHARQWAQEQQPAEKEMGFI